VNNPDKKRPSIFIWRSIWNANFGYYKVDHWVI